MIVVHEKPLHWVEAFGLSALLHVGLTYIVFTSVVDVGTFFEAERDTPADVQITSLAVDIDTVFSADIGTGSTPGNGPESLAPVTPDLSESAAPAVETLAPEATAPELAPVSAAPIVAAIAQAPASSAPPPATATTPISRSPLRPVNSTAVLAEPQATAAHTLSDTYAPTPQSGGAPQAAPNAMAPLVAEAIKPIQPTPSPAPAPLPATATSSETDPLAEELIARIRNSVAATCLIALPQQQNGGVSLQVFAADEGVVGPYVDDILSGLSPRPPLTTALIDPRQCAALDYIRSTAGYPSGPMALGLDIARIDSGSELTGRLSGTGGRNITLLLVDDNGVTQDLGNYLTVGSNTARFAAPLRRSGPARDTRQLLLAIGTATRPASSSRQNGQLADDYFDALSAEIATSATITIAPFDVR